MWSCGPESLSCFFFLDSRRFHAHITIRFPFFPFATLTTWGKCSEIPFQMEAKQLYCWRPFSTHPRQFAQNCQIVYVKYLSSSNIWHIEGTLEKLMATDGAGG